MNFGIAMPPAKNAVELLKHYVGTVPDKVLATFVEDDGTEHVLTFAALDRAAANLGLQVAAAAQPGDRVLVAYDSGREFVVGLWAALYAGAIAVPVDPPGVGRPAANVTRIRNVADDSGAVACIGARETREAIAASPAAKRLADQLRWVEPRMDALFAAREVPAAITSQKEEDVALLQYASGSTGAPKGTIATQANLLRMASAFLVMSSFETPFGQPDIEVTWLPLTHSTAGYGVLIKCLTGAVMPGCYIPPGTFARTPASWLRAISRYKGKQVYSVAPNFALDWCVSSTSEAERAELDLSGWTQFLCMGERVRPETWSAFCAAFAPRGFSPKLFIAGYGTSETGYVSGSINGGRSVLFDPIGVAVGRLVPSTDGRGVPLVSSSGFTLPGATVLIVDPDTREPLPAGQIGEIWVQTPAVMGGYWNRTEETETLFRAHTKGGDGPFFRTGDLGAYHEDELFITGRRKSVVVVRGRKHYAEDIEATLERELDWLDANSSIAFSDEVAGNEELFLAVEPRVAGALDPDAYTDAVRGVVGREFGIRVHEVLFVAPGKLPRTGIGKVARVACRDLFRAGELPMAARCGAFGKSGGAAATVADVRAILAEPTAERRVERMTGFVRSLLAATLAVPAEALSPTKTWNELGVDSMTGVRFHGELLRHLGAELPASTLYNYPTIARLAELICDKLTARAAAPEASWKRGAASSLAALDVENMTEEAAEAALLAHLDGAKR